MVDLHRHDELSTFDGFGKAEEIAKRALELGHTSCSTSNHGNTSNWAMHYKACMEAEIKPILGVEGYFKPDTSFEGRGFHLCLFAKNEIGYANINRIMFKAEKQKYYNPIITWSELERWSEGVICSTACIAGYIPKLLKEGKKKEAWQIAKRFKQIFGDNFYFEIMPYKIDKEGTQERVNRLLIALADKLEIKCVLTSDSHYIRKIDWDTYLKMHEIGKHNYDIEQVYKEHYIPSAKALVKRFVKMHEGNIDSALNRAIEFIANLEEIEAKIDMSFMEDFEAELPAYDSDEDSLTQLKDQVKRGLKKRGRWNKDYHERCKFEMKVIHHLGYNDYFLIVADYINYAKERGIVVGPGRGSGCNSLVCYALGITDTDSLKFDLDFSRFLRMDKKKMPDLDLDFETARRHEVIDYIVRKYKGQSAQICSYGLYKIDNLINDLAKVCKLNPIDKDVSEDIRFQRKERIKLIKKLVYKYMNEQVIDMPGLMERPEIPIWNKEYDNIMKHFSKMYGKVRFIGTHAAGVAITKGNILKRVGLRVVKDKVTGKKKIFTNYDLNDLEKVEVLKFDILGLKTMESIGELRRMTDIEEFDDNLVNDEKIIEQFHLGETDGIFQFESKTARGILQDIACDCFNDVVAASSMNRPGPLSLGMPEQYAHNKFNLKDAQKAVYYKYTNETYGTLVYQEQIQQICVNVAQMSWSDADAVMKIMKSNASALTLKRIEKESGGLKEKFIEGAVANKVKRLDAEEMFQKMMTYSFNKGHGTGYSLISVEEMFFKVYHPEFFWMIKMRYCADDKKMIRYKMKAVEGGSVILLPHVNGTAQFSLTKYEGEQCIQEGLDSILGIGEKLASMIEAERLKNGDYKNITDLTNRIPKRNLNIRTVAILETMGAAEFNMNRYLNRTEKYNIALRAKT